MADIEDLADSSALRVHPSEAEISKLLLDAARQYEECMRVADMADASEITEESEPRYAWDNPIGLVVTGR